MSRRVAMFVLNSCANDARVLREAAALVRAGHEVRIHALADADWPAGRSTRDDGVEIERLAATSLFQRFAKAKPKPRDTSPSPAPTTDAVPATAPRKMRRLGMKVTRRAVRPLRSARRRVTRTTTRIVQRVGRRLLRPFHIWSLYGNFAKLATAASDGWRPDVAHAHDLSGLVAAARVARRHESLLIYDSHELWRHRNAPVGPVRRLFEHLLERRWIARSDGVITVSPSIARWLAREYSLDTEPVVLRNIPESTLVESSDHLRRSTGLAPATRIVLYTGRITTGRGIEDCVHALALLPHDIHLVMLGYGPDAVVAGIHDLAGRLGVTDRVHHAPAVEPHQVVSAAAAADVALVAIEAVCLSYEYALPNKLFEALHAHLPVVATDLTELSELVESGGFGVLYRSGRHEELADALRKILDDPEPYRRKAAAAAAELTWEREQQRLLGLYAKLNDRPEHHEPSR